MAYSDIISTGRPSTDRRRTLTWAAVEPRAKMAFELLIIVAWAAWVGRAYLNLNPQIWVDGVDAPGLMLPFFQWQLLPHCGTCVFWNGSLDGGVPAFTELTGGLLHPVMMALVLAYGVVNATKLAAVVGLALAGVAQLWLARWMRLGPVARVWSALLAVTGGHLAARLDAGTVGIVFSAGFCTLVIPASLELARWGRRRAAVGLAFWLALAALSGQGYLQLALGLGVFPAISILLFENWQGRMVLSGRWRQFVLAGVLTLLLTAVLWVPTLHASSSTVKLSYPDFDKAQPLEYLPLNLVINDNATFYHNDVLHKDPAPAFNATYIGWLPVALAVFAIPSLARKRPRWLVFFLTAIVLCFLLGSAVLLKWIQFIVPQVTVIRFPTLMVGLAIPLILGLSAWGVEQLWQATWPTLTGITVSGVKVELRLNWLLLVLLALALKSAYDFGQQFLRTKPSLMEPAYSAFEKLRSPSAQWITVPDGEFYFGVVAVDLGMKVTMMARQGMLVKSDSDYPPAILGTTVRDVDPNQTPVYRKVDGLIVVDFPENQYASIDTDQASFPCTAQAQGGNIDVDCHTDEPGQLTVHEDYFSGWQVWLNGQPATLGTGPWLTTKAPAGQNHFEFRYQPWDVYLGLALTVLGGILALGLWIWPSRRPDGELEAC